MNTPNNRRRRESIQKIEQVFLELLQTRGLNEISVSEVCKLAGLNRSTFYANYTDVYGVADSVRSQLEKAVSELYQEEITVGFNSSDYLKLFRHIRDHQSLYAAYFKLGYDEEPQIFRYDTKLAEQHFQNRFIPYHIAFFKSGINRVIEMWLQNGCRESPEDMVEIIESEYRGREEFFSDRIP